MDSINIESPQEVSKSLRPERKPVSGRGFLRRKEGPQQEDTPFLEEVKSVGKE